MKRPWDGERYLRLVEKVRAAMPDCAIRTTFIVGFPGETEAEFVDMLGFIREARLDRVGAFLFSKEPGTPSYDLPNQVPTKVKKDRYERLMKVQMVVSREVNKSWIGKPLKVLIEENRDGWSAGRSHRDAPEIDGLVFVEGEHPVGEFVEATITDAAEYDLYAGSASALKGRKPMTQLRMAGPRAPQ